MDICMKMKLTIGLLYILQTCIGMQGEYTYRYMGCYKDDDGRALSEYYYTDNNRSTIEYCLDFCSQKDYKYAGLEYGDECWCGNSGYNKHGTSDGCTYECTGNENQTCGGWYSLSVYAITYLPEQITTTTQSETSVSVPATSSTTTTPASNLPATMVFETTPLTTTTTTANSFTTIIEVETTTSPTNTVITTSTSILPNSSTHMTNNSMVTTDRHVDGNMTPDNPRGKRNSGTYIGIGVGAAVVCATIALVIVLVVRRRKESDDRLTRPTRPTLTESPAAYENVGEINESTRQDQMATVKEADKYVNVNLQQMVESSDGTGSDYLNIGSPADATYTSVVAASDNDTHLYAALK